MEYPVEHRAERLLREMGRQAEGKHEPIVDPTEAAKRLNIDTSSPVYDEAVDRLVERGYLEKTHHPALGTTLGPYRLTEEGMAKAEELRGEWCMGRSTSADRGSKAPRSHEVVLRLPQKEGPEPRIRALAR